MIVTGFNLRIFHAIQKIRNLPLMSNNTKRMKNIFIKFKT